MRGTRVKKECFTCATHTSRKRTQQEKKDMRKKTGKWRTPSLLVRCTVTNKEITLNDPACPSYTSDPIMETVREDMSRFAIKERERFEG